MGEVALRPLEDADLDALFEQMRDPESVRMAAFVSRDPTDRAAFDAHMARIRSRSDVTNRVITLDGRVVGSIAAFVIEGDTEVTYWVDRAFWGQGIAGRALALLLQEVPVRPLFGRAAGDNLGSLRVLRRAIKIAATPPMGPVYVCLPQDVLDAITTEPVRATSIPSTRVAPNDALLEQAAQMLLAAERPMIYIGNGVAWSQAHAELERVAELLGAEVWEADGGDLNMRYDHPLYQAAWGTCSRPRAGR